jgi:hypothetical protein
VGRPSPRDRAREVLADSFLALGPAYLNLANLIRTGFENFWITPCLDAMTPLVLLVAGGESDDDDEDEG